MRILRPLTRLILFATVMPLLLGRVVAQEPESTSPRSSVHVALTGDDQADGSVEHPVKTVERGLALMRSHRVPREGAELILHGGTHFLAQPLKLGPDDSGFGELAEKGAFAAPPKPVVLRSADGERATLSAGQRLTDFREIQIGERTAWETVIPEVAAGTRWFRHLWVNGQPAQRARWPKQGYLKPEIDLPPSASPRPPTGAQGSDRFTFAAGDLWSNLVRDDVDLVLLHYWVAPRLRLIAVDDSSRTAQLSFRPRYKLFEKPNVPPSYYLENVGERLTEPGEWCLDRKTGRLTYLPRLGERLSNAEIIIPRHHSIVEITGALAKKRSASLITLRALTFSHSEAQQSETEYGGSDQAAFRVPGAIVLDGTEYCSITDCTVENIGGYGIEVRNSREISLTYNTLRHLGAGGIKIGPQGMATRVTITDNRIYDAGRHWPAGVGILVGSHSGNVIAYNHIHDLNYSGISVGWNWGYGEAPAYGNIIEWNHIHKIGRKTLSDLGGIYTLGVATGTRIRYNFIHDVSARTYGGRGIYLDEGSSRTLTEYNIVTRTSDVGLFIHYGAENTISNNIFDNGSEGGIGIGRREGHQTLIFRKNIITTQGQTIITGGFSIGDSKDSFKAIFDRNLYQIPKRNGNNQIARGGINWKIWQRAGFDPNSILGDPKFRNARKLDFRLPPNSPAHRLGFVGFSLAEVGPRTGHPIYGSGTLERVTSSHQTPQD